MIDQGRSTSRRLRLEKGKEKKVVDALSTGPTVTAFRLEFNGTVVDNFLSFISCKRVCFFSLPHQSPRLQGSVLLKVHSCDRDLAPGTIFNLMWLGITPFNKFNAR